MEPSIYIGVMILVVVHMPDKPRILHLHPPRHMYDISTYQELRRDGQILRLQRGVNTIEPFRSPRIGYGCLALSPRSGIGVARSAVQFGAKSLYQPVNRTRTIQKISTPARTTEEQTGRLQSCPHLKAQNRERHA